MGCPKVGVKSKGEVWVRAGKNVGFFGEKKLGFSFIRFLGF